MYLNNWKDSQTKKNIVNFINDTSNKASPDFIPVNDRVAAFDNDGTLWVEQPAPAQAGLLVKKLVDKAKSDPKLAKEEPFKSILEKDPAFLTGLAQQVPEIVISFLRGVGKAWENTSPEEYDKEVAEYLQNDIHPKYNLPWTDLIYQPMLELFDFLRDHNWRIFVCSGGGRDFMRVFSEDKLGVSKENIIGSAPEFSYRDGQLLRQNKLLGNVSLGPGKIEHIYARTGRKALFACGNGDVDIEMLKEAKFRVVIAHDDERREYKVTEAAEKLLAIAEKKSWTIVSMKNDWKTVFKTK